MTRFSSSSKLNGWLRFVDFVCQISVKESRLVFLVWLLSRFGFNSDYILLG